ncbi:MAG: hypothetical protein ACP5G5_03695 [Thermoplasmata archaeon]|jgi:hypothetical protein|nr:hypothetical protein [Euryarchaeota archaeon]
MSYQGILSLLESSPGLLILFTVLVAIAALEAIAYLRSIRYILLGILISGLVFIGLNYYFFGINIHSLEPVLYFIVLTGTLLVLTFILALFIFIIILVDILLILHVFFLMDLNSIYTWIAGIIVSIILYLILHYAGKKLNREVFDTDKELKGGA